MDKRVLRVLEFTKIRDQLCEHAVSPLGKTAALELEPASEYRLIERAQQETEEAYGILARAGGSPMTSFEDISEALRLAVIGGAISAKALLGVARVMRVGREVREALCEKEEAPLLADIAKGMMTFRTLEQDISEAILSEDEISDHASGDLYDIRRAIRRCNDRVREKLNAMIHNPNMQKYLQDNIITMRNDRYVLPVKQEARSFVPGLVHDQSASGATLFIEPMSIVEVNNELKQKILEERKEIERILAAFAARVGAEAEMLAHVQQTLVILDVVFAKAALSRSMRGIGPKIRQDGYVKLVRARHPLIAADKVVPSDLWLGREFTTLIITGPNTGGKSVTLKTVGLFTLMMQAGLHVPADLGTELSVFDDVFVDLGDEQSIEQSLSTFSSHMSQIVKILEGVTPRSLVLLDELGAGTDPTEGAALGIALLDFMLARKIRTLATTHYSELKAYALTNEGVENASVEFNVETLRPTYRLSIGVPGKSNAFEISRKLGLPEDVIDQARAFLSKEQIRFEDVIANAEYHRQVAEKERLLAEEAHIQVTRMRDEMERTRLEMDNQRKKMLEKAKEDARRIVQNARMESEQVVAELKKMRAEVKTHEITEHRQKLDKQLGALAPSIAAKDDKSSAPKTVKPGDSVMIVSMNAKGTVLQAPDKAGMVRVQAGVMKMSVALSDLRLIQAEKPKAKAGSIAAAAPMVPMELDVRGMMVDEAVPVVDQYLDDAARAGRTLVHIIHGKGTGALRAGIQAHLKRHPHVDTFRLGAFGEGEAGVTVVTVK